MDMKMRETLAGFILGFSLNPNVSIPKIVKFLLCLQSKVKEERRKVNFLNLSPKKKNCRCRNS